MSPRAALCVVVPLLLLVGCATGAGARSSESPSPQVPGKLAPCDSQTAPGGDLLSCSEARQTGAPWLPADTPAQLDWYKLHDDSEPMIVWAFSNRTIEHPSGVMGPEGEEPLPVCILGDWGLVLNAVSGLFITEGFTGSTPTTCPTA